jgi:hypothetical protein
VNTWRESSRRAAVLKSTTLKKEITTQLAAPASSKENYLMTVISTAFVAGMAIALGIYFAWTHGVIPPAFNGAASMAALFVCPPYILSIAMGPTAEADLMQVVVAGTIVFANGFLYAGFAAGAYYLFTLFFKRGK